MDRIYRRQRHVYDFTRKYYLFGRDRMIRELALRPGDRLAEIGCGTARNLVKIARAYPGTRLFGLDASSQMLETAAHAVARARLANQIHLAKGYAESLSPALFGEKEGFDQVLFSYSLSMIPDWKQALSRAAATLKENGSVRIVDFGDLAGLRWPFASLLLAWLALFNVAPRAELLHRFEEAGARRGLNLRLLPGRYAFLLSLSKQELGAAIGAVAR